METTTTSGGGDEEIVIPLPRPLNELHNQGVPSPEEVEITVLGIGGNSGESVVIHVGNGDWVVIDSCKTRAGMTLPLYYLETIGADLSKVAIVACTHLHGDHIEGLSDVLTQCKEARFAYSLVGDHNTMRYIIAQYCKDKNIPNGGTFDEFMKCISICNNERRHPVVIGIDQTIYAGRNGQIYGISPSYKMNEIYQWKLLKYDLDEDIPKNMLKTNFCSVASILSIGEVKALLGADLEANRNHGTDHLNCSLYCKRRNKRGWCNAVEDSQNFPLYKYDYIKIPHHSSVNGYCPKLWSQYMKKDTIGTSTIFLQGNVSLPEDYMIDLYKSHCKELYYTSDIRTTRKDNKGKSKLEEVKVKAIKDMVVMQENIGIITSRKPMDGSRDWNTNFYESAIRIK